MSLTQWWCLLKEMPQQWLESSFRKYNCLCVIRYMDSAPKNLNSVIIYSPSSCSKPEWVSFFCWTQKKIFWSILVPNSWRWPLTSIVFSSMPLKSMATVKCSVNPHYSQYLLLCLAKERNEFRFETSRGWVHYDWVFIWSQTVYNCDCLWVSWYYQLIMGLAISSDVLCFDVTCSSTSLLEHSCTPFSFRGTWRCWIKPVSAASTLRLRALRSDMWLMFSPELTSVPLVTVVFLSVSTTFTPSVFTTFTPSVFTTFTPSVFTTFHHLRLSYSILTYKNKTVTQQSGWFLCKATVWRNEGVLRTP